MKSILAASVAALPLALSASAQAPPPPFGDIPYYVSGASPPSCNPSCSPPCGPMQSLDVHVPAFGPVLGPTVLYVHGGGWSGNDKAGPNHLAFAHTLRDLGHSVVSVNYTLACAGAGYELAIQDVRAALAWIRGPGAAAPYSLNPCVVAVGTSAGGHLVSMLGTVADASQPLFKPVGAWPVSSLRPDGVITLSAPEDFYRSGVSGMASSGCPQSSPICNASFLPDFVLNPGPPVVLTSYGNALDNYLNCSWGSGAACVSLPCTPATPVWNDPCLAPNTLTGHNYVDASPIHWVSPGDPPFHLTYTSCDGIVPGIESVWMFNALRRAAVPVSLDNRDHCGHAFTTFAGGPVEAASYVDHVIASEFAGYCP